MSENVYTPQYSQAPERFSKNPSVLAFVGDAYYSLLVRTHLSDRDRPSGELHRLSVGYVSASAQSEAFHRIEPLLSEEETDIFKRGRNFHTGNVPKNASHAEYHTATGLEALFGYLYLSGQTERAEELFRNMFDENTKISSGGQK